MFKNRFLIVLGVLSLFLVAMAVSLPLSGIPASGAANSAIQHGQEAYAARWIAMGEYYQKQAEAAKAEASMVDSATRSYTAWAKAAEAETSTVDSATRSYIAQAKAVACGVDATHGPHLDSATRSYIAWGFALQAKDDIRACQ